MNNKNNFSNNPIINTERSQFDRSSNHKTTFNAARLIPIYLDEILPGDTVQIQTDAIIRTITPITPVMDNMRADVFWFFVPNRLIWKNWNQFMGENKTGAWTSTYDGQVPQITAPSSGWNIGSLADYLGLPIEKGNYSINHLPFRAYALIWNEWFRDQNFFQEAFFQTGDTTVAGNNNQSNYITDINTGGYVPKVMKQGDYFTTCLPSPQKGNIANILENIDLPVITKNAKQVRTEFEEPLQFVQWADGQIYNSVLTTGATTGHLARSSITPQTVNNSGMIPTNLYAKQTAINVNQFREAFQIQHLLEKDARGGTRYTEIIKSHFGVISPDARQQRPEFLGGEQIPIRINQVPQTSSTDSTSPQGNTAAFSLTGASVGKISKSFTEHGYILGLMTVRQEHSYSQGIEKLWSRKTKYDYYWPALANLGEQPVLNKELYLSGNTTTDEQVFGYNEAWADYRYKLNKITGRFRPETTINLAIWHYGDKFTATPSLNTDFIKDTDQNIARTLALATSNETHQFLVDIWYTATYTRAMPVYSIPGLIDHH